METTASHTQAYLATSSEESEDSGHFSDDDSDHGDDRGDDEGGNDAVEANKRKGRKEKKLQSAAAARRARKVLLEDALGSDADMSGSDEEEREGDDAVADATEVCRSWYSGSAYYILMVIV